MNKQLKKQQYVENMIKHSQKVIRPDLWSKAFSFWEEKKND